MIYLVANTCDKHMLWQIQVQHSNLKRLGVDLSNVYNLVVYKNSIEPLYQEYANKAEANIIFIKDDYPISRNYIPSIKPFAYKKFFEQRPELINELAFYCDQDVIFTSRIDENKFQQNKIYFSNTISYIGAKYILSKGETVLKDMCDVVGINPTIVKKYEDKSGGAQFCGRNLNVDFWNKVEIDSITMYNRIANNDDKYKDEFEMINKVPMHKNNRVQIWCAEMWATLWNVWLNGYDSEIHNELEFRWASNSIVDMINVKILHNTGLSNADKTNVFNKSDYGHVHILDIPSDVFVRENSCTFIYYVELSLAKIYIRNLYRDYHIRPK